MAYVGNNYTSSAWEEGLTFALDTTSADFIVVGARTNHASGITGATYHGQALTRVESGSVGGAVFVGAIASGDRGNYNVVVTFAGFEVCSAAAACWSGVNQTTPYDAASVQVDASATTTPSVAVTSETGDFVVAVDLVGDNPPTRTDPGTDETERLDQIVNTYDMFWIADQAGAASVTIAPTRVVAGAFWYDRLIAFNVNAAASGLNVALPLATAAATAPAIAPSRAAALPLVTAVATAQGLAVSGALDVALPLATATATVPALLVQPNQFLPLAASAASAPGIRGSPGLPVATAQATAAGPNGIALELPVATVAMTPATVDTQNIVTLPVATMVMVAASLATTADIELPLVSMAATVVSVLASPGLPVASATFSIATPLGRGVGIPVVTMQCIVLPNIGPPVPGDRPPGRGGGLHHHFRRGWQ